MNCFIDCKTVVFSCLIRLNQDFLYLNRIFFLILTVKNYFSGYRTVPAVHLSPKPPAYVWNEFRFVWKIPEAETPGIRFLLIFCVNALINVWVTENGGNTGILLEFVANTLQTVEDWIRLRTPLFILSSIVFPTYPAPFDIDLTTR